MSMHVPQQLQRPCRRAGHAPTDRPLSVLTSPERAVVLVSRVRELERSEEPRTGAVRRRTSESAAISSDRIAPLFTRFVHDRAMLERPLKRPNEALGSSPVDKSTSIMG